MVTTAPLRLSVSSGSGLAERRRKEHAAPMPRPESQIPRRRRSACADASLRAEIERVGRMSIGERVKAALSMRERFAWLTQAPKRK